MGNPYVDQTKNDKSHILTLRVVSGIFALMTVIVLLIVLVLSQEPPKQRISLPPTLQYGADLTTGEMQAWEVYNFAGTVYQQINLWRDDGEQDYARNISIYRGLVTHRYLAAKYKEYQDKRNRGELNLRTRSITPLGHYSVDGGCGAYSDRCVQSLGANRWKVWLDVRVQEYQLGKKEVAPYPIKDLAMRVPVLVVYEPDDPQLNPWGLKIDQEFGLEMERIDMDAERKKLDDQLKEQEAAQKAKESNRE